MSKLNYILKSFKFYRKQHLALVLACVISTAVITGSLIIGDSVGYSLKQIVESRLGSIEFVLQSNNRFVRTELAKEMAAKLNAKAASVLTLQGVLSNPENELRKNKVQVNGIDTNFWLFANTKMPLLKNNEAIISQNLAEELGLKKGDDMGLRIEKIEVLPLNSPFNAERTNYISLRLKIIGIADKNSMGNFSLKNNQVAAYNVFVSGNYLSHELDLSGMTNTILVSQNNENSLNAEQLDNALSKLWKPIDAGLKINKIDSVGGFEMVSSRVFIEDKIASAVLNYYKESETFLTYLVNSLRTPRDTTPYSFLTATSLSFNGKAINDDEIIINEWLANDLKATIGDAISIDYFVIGPMQNLKEEIRTFVVKQIISTEDAVVNRTLMPDFPGFSDATSCKNWNANIPIDLHRIRAKDEAYWNTYKGTPKALISINAGHNIWGNKYGHYTAIRFNDSAQSPKEVNKQIIALIKPQELNLKFVPAKREGLNAADNGIDFGELFLSLSFFVILAGIILIIVIYNLNALSRKSETGLLFSLGYKKSQIRNLQIYENTLPVLMGSIMGVGAGILFNMGILKAINSVWNAIVRTNMLDIYLKPATLLTGLLSGFTIAMISIYVVTQRNLKATAIEILNNTSGLKATQTRKGKIVSKLIAFVSFAGAVSIIIYALQTSVDQNAPLFLGAGGLFLLGSLLLVRNIILKRKTRIQETLSLTGLSFKNAGRNMPRTMTVLILLSLGTFVVIITGANRKTFAGEEKLNSSGTGGYTYWAETSVPVLNDINTRYGKEKLGLVDEAGIDSVEFLQIHALDGDDASCLNLNQVVSPRIIGVNTNVLNQRHSFSFAGLMNNADKNNPWQELNKSYGNNVIPAYADQTVITWGLKKKLGDTLIYSGENGEKIYLVLVGGLNASIFQGNIIIAENNFFKHFPSADGSKIMLVDTKGHKEVAKILSSDLQDYGLDISKTNDRLATFNSVTNTYLSVFMILGALGIFIGTIGLGIILYKNLLDRRQEMALLSAIGYTKKDIFKLIFTENLLLIIIATAIGIVSAFIGILPSLLSASFNIPQAFLFWLIIITLLNSILWTYFPIRNALKRNLISALRNE